MYTVVNPHCERATGRRLPGILLIIIVFGNDNHSFSNKVGGVEAYSKLTNHGDVGSSLEEQFTSLLN